MTAFLIQNMAPIMFVALVVFLLLGYPAAFSLGAVGLIFALIGIELGQFAPDFLQALPERIYGVMSNDTLLAIPFFTFMPTFSPRSRRPSAKLTAVVDFPTPPFPDATAMTASTLGIPG